MPYPFLYQNQHHAQALAFFCMDFRFKDATLAYLKHELQLVDLDVAVLAGASKNLIYSQKSKVGQAFMFDSGASKVGQTSMPDFPNFETAIKQIELSIKLHHIKKIILIDHADCGAYGGAAAFETSQKEREAHVVNLRKAKEILVQKFSNKEIILFYAALKDQEIKFEKVK